MLVNYLLISALMFGIGAFAVLTRRNPIALLMGIELMLNAANLNFIAFWRFLAPSAIEAHVFVLVGISVAAAEAALGLAIVLNLYWSRGNIDLNQLESLKG